MNLCKYMTQPPNKIITTILEAVSEVLEAPSFPLASRWRIPDGADGEACFQFLT